MRRNRRCFHRAGGRDAESAGQGRLDHRAGRPVGDQQAFAVVTMAAMHEMKLPHDKVNVNGGACALGHPIGASGAPHPGHADRRAAQARPQSAASPACASAAADLTAMAIEVDSRWPAAESDQALRAARETLCQDLVSLGATRRAPPQRAALHTSKDLHSSAMILTQEQELIRDSMRASSRRSAWPLLPNGTTHTFPREALNELAELGALGMVVPRNGAAPAWTT